jgi:hypothetical protein
LASRKISFLASVSSLISPSMFSMRSTIARNWSPVDWSAHGLLLVNMAPRNFAILAAISRSTSERGDQPVNVRPASPIGDDGEGRATQDCRTFGLCSPWCVASAGRESRGK